MKESPPKYVRLDKWLLDTLYKTRALAQMIEGGKGCVQQTT